MPLGLSRSRRMMCSGILTFTKTHSRMSTKFNLCYLGRLLQRGGWQQKWLCCGGYPHKLAIVVCATKWPERRPQHVLSPYPFWSPVGNVRDSPTLPRVFIRMVRRVCGQRGQIRGNIWFRDPLQLALPTNFMWERFSLLWLQIQRSTSRLW